MPENHAESEAGKASDVVSGGYPADERTDHDTGDSGGQKGSHTHVTRVIMKLMYAARMARPDLLRTTSYLARYLTKWDNACGKRLSKLMARVQNTIQYRMCSWCDASRARPPLHLRVYSDADYVGCTSTQRSIIGAIAFIHGDGYSEPLSRISKRQGCVSRSTPESEIVAMDTTIRLLTIPLLQLCEEVLGVASVELWGGVTRQCYAFSRQAGAPLCDICLVLTVFRWNGCMSNISVRTS